jgi:2-dehydro-3-deoxyphosphooctonate aldolase (KDO 8-P synthase)
MIKRIVKIKDLVVGENYPIFLILGPCVIENYNQALSHAKEIKSICEKEKINFIFKSSYDKANRTSIKSYRGPGLKEGLRILKDIKDKLGIYVTSDVHCKNDVEKVAKVLDLIQIPALLSRQTDLIVEAAKTGIALNIKKGQFMAPWDVIKACEKAYSTGNKNILVTERGTVFGYNNLVNDFRAIPIMQKMGLVVVFDATHSVQTPSGLGESSGGRREFVRYLARAATAIGCDGLFFEVHKNPDKALSDSQSMVDFKELNLIIKEIKKIRNAIFRK